MSIGTQRARLYVAVITAFVGGLIVASGMNWTKLGFAQSRPSAAQVQPIAEASNAFVAIANNVTPAVVSIEVFSAARSTGTTQRGRGQSPQAVPPGLDDFFRQFDIPPQSRPTRGQGSGFIVTSNGYILTNNHVVTNSDRETIADKVTVRMMDHRVFTAKVVGHDRTTDVAVIKIDGGNFPTVSLGNDVVSRIGEWVLAIGNPLGLENTVTAGIISAKGRSLADLMNPNGENKYAISDLIQTDAAINPGNSGGPLVNSRGEVIGINSAIASPTGYNAGYGFAIPITLAKRVMDEIIAHGRVRVPALGIQIDDVSPEDAAVAGVKDIRGVLVRGFPPEIASARNAGLEPGDVIITADGQPVDRVSTLQRIVRNHNPGESIDIEVMRYGKRKVFRVPLVEANSNQQVATASTRTEPSGGGSVHPALGISVAPVSTELPAQARMTTPVRGVMVSDVIPGGPAEDKLFRNDVITEVLYPAPARAINTPGDLQQALGRLKNGDYVSLKVFSLAEATHAPRIVNLQVDK
ncbi:MAG TPA: trypsin-like peptidase domain-containing protein [Gemmatimonadaceae bacterium]|nr:trypsin-like peptidase domain-containing protein [Gemmatimonadaceae bacterium]